MKILTTAFLALVFWIAWGVVSVKFGVSDAVGSLPQMLAGQHAVIQKTGGQQAVLVGTFIPAALLTLATVVMLVRFPFKARKRRRAARDQFNDE